MAPLKLANDFACEKSLTSRMNYAIKKDANNGAMTSVIQRRAVGFDSCIWVSSCLAAFFGVLTAAYSQEPLYWLLVWPVPLALACTIFNFIRQGFHFQNGLLVLGRRKG
jgi:hypothetical protein